MPGHVRAVEHLLVTSTGHNLSLGRAARYYHCRILGFAEQALALSQVRPSEEQATRTSGAHR